MRGVLYERTDWIVACFRVVSLCASKQSNSRSGVMKSSNRPFSRRKELMQTILVFLLSQARPSAGYKTQLGMDSFESIHGVGWSLPSDRVAINRQSEWASPKITEIPAPYTLLTKPISRRNRWNPIWMIDWPVQYKNILAWILLERWEPNLFFKFDLYEWMPR